MRHSSRRLAVVLATTFTALAAPHAASAGSYGWPIRPFDQQHPVRGFFGDPRIGEGADGHAESKAFHFGVDISAADGTPVYATASGRIVWEPQRPETVAIRSDDGRVFAYWHIVPVPQRTLRRGVRNASRAHRVRLGPRPLRRLVDGEYVNPLRRGALTPYRDATRPTIHAFSFERDGRPSGRH